MSQVETPQPTERSGKALASLILGITSLVLCLTIFTGIPAIILGIIALGQTNREGLGGRGMAITGIVLGAIGIVFMPILGTLVGMLLPAFMAVQESALDTNAKMHMRQTSLGLVMYESNNGHFPAAASGEEPNLVSWRVQIAPFIEGQFAFDQYQMDQPWDSETNNELVPMIPEILQDTGAASAPGYTNFLVLAGNDNKYSALQSLFQPSDRPPTTSRIKDGPSHTIIIVEVDDTHAVPWTKPQDINYNPRKPLEGLGNKRAGHFNAAFADGSVRAISSDIDPDAFRAMVTPRGGEMSTDDYIKMKQQNR